MKQINWGDFVRGGAKTVIDELPVEILYDGEPVFIVSKVEDVIVVSDLHIRVRNMLRAQEKKARAGMPQPVKIETSVMTS